MPKALAHTPAETFAQARQHVQAVNIVFLNQFGIFRLPGTRRTLDKLFQASLFSLLVSHLLQLLRRLLQCCFAVKFWK